MLVLDVLTLNASHSKLKLSARPMEKLDDPYCLVSAADCRLMTFETVDEAT
jgi:phosphatidylserine decarboxylase